MTEKYAEFDKNPIVDVSDITFKGWRFGKREVALGITLIVCLLVIIILAALLATAHSDQDNQSSALNGGSCHKNECFSPPCLKTAAHVTELLNDSVNPCDDFHTFACGQFPTLHPLAPYDTEMTTFQLIHNKNMERLRLLLEQKQDPRTSQNSFHYETKLRTFFATCQDHFTKMQQQGRPFLQQVVDQAGGWWALKGDGVWSSDAFNFQNQLEKVHVDFWTDAFFTFNIITDWLDWNKKTIQISLSGLGLRYDYYYKPEYAKFVRDYKTFMRTVGGLLLRDAALNLTAAQTKERLDTFLSDAFFVESELARIKRSSQSTFGAHSQDKRMKLSDLNRVSNGAVDWVSLFQYMFNEAPVTADTYVVVLEQDYIANFTAWMNSMNPTNKTRILNNYMMWRLAQHYVQDLSWDYIHANRQVYVDINGATEFLGTWRYCLYKLDRDMKEALGALFVSHHFSEQNKRTAHSITDQVKSALVDSLTDSDWMSASTKKLAVMKIKESLIKLGYPDYMMNAYSLNEIFAKLTITNDYFSNLLSFNGFFKHDWNQRLKNQNPRSVWTYATYDFVAQYFNPWKELMVPAGMLQFPIYDHSSPGYTNFGSMGSIVARQLIHAVDEIGNYYMLNGSHFGNWWSNETMKKYKEVRSCIIRAFNDTFMGPFDTSLGPKKVKVNIKYYAPLALGEVSGVKLAYMGTKKWSKKWNKISGTEKYMPGHKYSNEQMFFISYAQTYCKTRDPSWDYRKVRTGRTLTERVKVNSALAHLPEFQKAFMCDAQSPMVSPTRCGLY